MDSSGTEMTSVNLVRPACYKAIPYDAPFTLQRFLSIARELYPWVPAGKLVVETCVSRPGQGDVIWGQFVDEEMLGLHQHWESEFLDRYKQDEDVVVIRKLRQVMVRDGTNRVQPAVPWNVSTHIDRADVRRELVDCIIHLLNINPDESDIPVRIQVGRKKGEWLQWQKGMSQDEWTRLILWKIDDTDISVYPGGWVREMTFEEAEEDRERQARVRPAAFPTLPIQTPTPNSSVFQFHATSNSPAPQNTPVAPTVTGLGEAFTAVSRSAADSAAASSSEDDEGVPTHGAPPAVDSTSVTSQGSGPGSQAGSSGNEPETSDNPQDAPSGSVLACPIHADCAWNFFSTGVNKAECIAIYQHLQRDHLLARCPFPGCHVYGRELCRADRVEHIEMHERATGDRCPESGCCAPRASMTPREIRQHLEMHRDTNPNDPNGKCDIFGCFTSLRGLTEEQYRHHLEMHGTRCLFGNCHANLDKLTTQERNEHDRMHETCAERGRNLAIAEAQGQAMQRSIEERDRTIQDQASIMEKTVRLIATLREGKGKEVSEGNNSQPSKQSTKERKLDFCNVCIANITSLGKQKRAAHLRRCKSTEDAVLHLEKQEAKEHKARLREAGNDVYEGKGKGKAVDAPEAGASTTAPPVPQRTTRTASKRSREDDDPSDNENDSLPTSPQKKSKT